MRAGPAGRASENFRGLKNLKKILHWKKFDKKSKYLNFHLGYNMSLPVVKGNFLMCLLYEQGV